MKRVKIFSILMSLAVVISIGFSVFAVVYVASADEGKNVQLVTLDYIENSLMKEIDDKIQQGSVDSMKESIDAINQTLDYLNAQVSVQGADMQSVKDEIYMLKSLLLSLNSSFGALDSRVKAENEKLSQQISALQGRVDALEDTCEILTQDVGELKSSVFSLSERVTALEDTVAALKASLEAGIAELNGRIAVNTENISLLTSNAETMKSGLDMVKMDLGNLISSHTALQMRYETLEGEYNSQRAELTQLKGGMLTLETKINNMSGDYGELIDAYNEYTKTIAALRLAVSEGSASFSAIFLKEGETLTCSGLPGDTMEIIVRRGSVAVTSPIPTQGLFDVNDSIELLDGKRVPEFHYILLVGGSDGRGVVSQSGDAWILVRGEYEIG